MSFATFSSFTPSDIANLVIFVGVAALFITLFLSPRNPKPPKGGF
jgi:hypothetical protein